MAQTTDHQQNIEKLRDLIKGIRIGMITTNSSDGQLHTRPMFTFETEFDGDLWFMTGSDSRKMEEVAGDHQVNVAYSDTGKNRYVSVSGQAQIVNDRAKIKDNWNPLLKAWFDGPDDPRIRLLKVSVTSAEYWDGPSGPVAKVLEIAKAVTKGAAPMGENETLKLK